MTPRTPPPVHSADLRLRKTDSPDPVAAGRDLTYTLTIANAGPTAAADVQATDTLPSGVVFVSAAASQGSCEGTDVVDCALGSLAVGDTAVITIVVRPAIVVETLPNSASVSAMTRDPDPANDVATASTTVTAAGA